MVAKLLKLLFNKLFSTAYAVEPEKPQQKSLVSDEVLHFIGEFEGFSDFPYKDIAGIWTIGYGTTILPDGRPVTQFTPMVTRAQGMYYKRLHLEKDAQRLKEFLDFMNYEYKAHEFDALLSFAYNLGFGPIVTKGKSVNRALYGKNRDEIAQSLLLYDKARINGELKKVAGLTRRRIAESNLFLYGYKK